MSKEAIHPFAPGDDVEVKNRLGDPNARRTGKVASVMPRLAMPNEPPPSPLVSVDFEGGSEKGTYPAEHLTYLPPVPVKIRRNRD